MDFNHLRTFLKVSELHSFSRAAEQLGYAQPTVSTQIARLEAELGQPLFQRMGHRITLTERGEQFLPYAQRMLLMTEQIQQLFHGDTVTGGTLKIAMADSLCSAYFTDLLLRFREAYPEISVVTYTGTTEALFQMLTHNEVDMVYTLDDRISRSDFVVRQEQREMIHFCAAAHHPLARRAKQGEGILWEDVKAYPLYLTEAGVSYRYDLERLLGERGEELRPAIEQGNVHTLMRLTSRSQGITFLPEFAIREEVAAGNLTILPVEGISVHVWRQLIYHRGKYLTEPMEAMIALLHGAAN